jgi:hypothetical protein
MSHPFVPMPEHVVEELRQYAMARGLSSEQSRMVLRELTRTEAERARLQAQIEGVHERRMGMREEMLGEVAAVRQELQAAHKRIDELQATLRAREADAAAAAIGESTDLQRAVAVATVVDDQTRAMAAQLVADCKLKTLEEAMSFAQGWIETAAQEARNHEFYKGVVERLRSAWGTARPAIKWVISHAPDPDPHSLAGHADVALHYLTEAFKQSSGTARVGDGE